MNIADVREYGLSLPHATERCPFGPDTLSLEIGGKMFCLMELSGQWQFYNLKVDPDFSIELQDRYPSIRPGYHMNKAPLGVGRFRQPHPARVEEELIRHAYYQTARGLTRKLRIELGFDF